MHAHSAPSPSIAKPSHPAPYCAAPSTQIVANCASSQRDASCGQPAVASGAGPAGETNGTAIRAGLIHPNALLRRIQPMLHTGPRMMGILQARKANTALAEGRRRISCLYAPLHAHIGADTPAGLDHWLRVGKPTHMRIAKHYLREVAKLLSEAEVIAETEKQFRGLTVPALRDAA